jgi:hypothetical protein
MVTCFLRCSAQVDKCFGFDTAVEEAQRALLAAKVEASSGYKGLGIVKLMGRSSGFIAMQASMASGEADSPQSIQVYLPLLPALLNTAKSCANLLEPHSTRHTDTLGLWQSMPPGGAEAPEACGTAACMRVAGLCLKPGAQASMASGASVSCIASSICKENGQQNALSTARCVRVAVHRVVGGRGKCSKPTCPYRIDKLVTSCWWSYAAVWCVMHRCG